MNFTLRMLRTATVEVPYPEVYWMERFQDWTRLEFQIGVLQGGGKTIVVNTGFPEDISTLAQGWRDYLGDRAVLERPGAWKTEVALKAVGIDPKTVDYVILTPIQLYATGNLQLFSKAQICISRRGWVEDILAPTYPHHVPRQGCISDADFFWLLGENAKNLRLLDDLEEILPGLTCRWAGVHHRSSMLVEAQTAKGLAILSDCAFHFANVEEQRPLGIAESIIEAHAVYGDIRSRAKHFIPLYDPLIHERYPNGVIA
jgi:glyoxylase-like metal-dependent hydrolase (beta-lactamase superfamily II)